MAQLTLRSISREGDTNVNRPLTNAEIDTNFINIDIELGTLQAQKAPLASPSLTGTPTAPTASAGTNTTQIATTAFVTTAVAGVGNGALSLQMGAAADSGSSVAVGVGSGFTANASSAHAYTVRVGPALSALATTMTGASTGILRKTGTDAYTLDEGLTAGSTSTGFLKYNGTVQATGQFDGGSTTPSATTRLNYNGNLYVTNAYAGNLYVTNAYATNFHGSGANLTDVGPEITNDTTTDATRFLLFDDATSGKALSIGTSNTKLYFNPSSGTLSATNFNSLSDLSLKENVTATRPDVILALSGVEFTWKDTQAKSAGVIAQDVEKIAPHLVSTNHVGAKSVNYNGIVAYLIETIKDLHHRLHALETGGVAK